MAASCVIFYILTVFSRLGHSGKTALLVLLAGLACCEKLGSIMNLVSVEKDWVPYLSSAVSNCHADDESRSLLYLEEIKKLWER